MYIIIGNAILSGWTSIIYWLITVFAEGFGFILPKPVNMIITLLIALGFAYKSYLNLYWDIDFELGDMFEKFKVAFKYISVTILNQVSYLVFLGLLGLIGYLFL